LLVRGFDCSARITLSGGDVAGGQRRECENSQNHSGQYAHANSLKGASYPMEQLMTKGRVEAFSDGVIAILITIMVLELKVPHETGLSALEPLIPVFLTYLLSFVFLGIYW